MLGSTSYVCQETGRESNPKVLVPTAADQSHPILKGAWSKITQLTISAQHGDRHLKYLLSDESPVSLEIGPPVIFGVDWVTSSGTVMLPKYCNCWH